MLQIEVPKRALLCAQEKEPLLQGAEYYSILMSKSEGEWQRQDFCKSCWEKVKEVKTSLAKCTWKSTVPEEHGVSKLLNERDTHAYFLLKEFLTQKEKESSKVEAFLLALYLARRRFLALRGEIETEEKHPLCLYEVVRTEEMLFVPKVSLVEIDLKKIQVQLAEKLSNSR